jgi:hypothetical protein
MILSKTADADPELFIPALTFQDVPDHAPAVYEPSLMTGDWMSVLSTMTKMTAISELSIMALKAVMCVMPFRLKRRSQNVFVPTFSKSLPYFPIPGSGKSSAR